MKRFFTFPFVRLALEALLILAVMAAILTRVFAARADSPQAPDATYWYRCNGPMINIGVFTNRVHVYCETTTPIGGGTPTIPAIHWFSVPTSPDSAGASRFMSLIQTAVITSSEIWVQVDPADTSGTSFGCASSDCRRIYGMEMR